VRTLLPRLRTISCCEETFLLRDECAGEEAALERGARGTLEVVLEADHSAGALLLIGGLGGLCFTHLLSCVPRGGTHG
jgi:hypothetical protein